MNFDICTYSWTYYLSPDMKPPPGEFPNSPVIKTLSLLRAQVWSLVRELRSHEPHGAAKIKKKKTTAGIQIWNTFSQFRILLWPLPLLVRDFQHYSDFFHQKVVWLMFELHVNEITYYIFFFQCYDIHAVMCNCSFVLFHGCVVSHCMNIPQSRHQPFYSWWTFGLFLIWGYYK